MQLFLQWAQQLLVVAVVGVHTSQDELQKRLLPLETGSDGRSDANGGGVQRKGEREKREEEMSE